MKPWKTISRTPVLRRGKYLTVEDHRVELPDGTVIDHWPWLTMPDYVNVVAQTVEGTFLCFRQPKYAVGDLITLAPVGGYIEPGEDAEVAARRELKEETGYDATEWIPLGVYVADGNRGGGNAHLFLACNSRQTAPRHADDLEEQELVALSREELEQALRNGEFKVLAWGANVALALLHLDRTH